ncbi:MAG: transglycosylase SLT domain-containing protein [Rikenellaceae bacterium]
MTRILLSTALVVLLTISSASANENRRKTLSRRDKKELAQQQQAQPVQEVDSVAIIPDTLPQEPEQPIFIPDTTITLSYTLPQIDSLINEWYELTERENFDRYFDNFISDDSLLVNVIGQDSLYKLRLMQLASPIALPYNNIVKGYISRYVNPRYNTMKNVVALSHYYFPLIEEELMRYDLPVELRSMAIIESALSADAISRAGAAGLWQFMPATGKAYGLEVNSLVDERCDPFKATDAACRFLRDLYVMFGNWTLAIAAYNCGPGNVNKALTRAGLDKADGSFWDIYQYLPRETRGYVPAFVGATYGYAYHREHDIVPAERPLVLATDTIQINSIMHFSQVSDVLGISLETLRALNPQYRKDIIPATKRSYSLRLPQTYIAKYIENEQEILAKDSTYLKEYLDPAQVERAMKTPRGSIHVIRSGETLGGIARKYGITQRALMSANNIRNAHRIYAGQRLVIPN